MKPLLEDWTDFQSIVEHPYVRGRLVAMGGALTAFVVAVGAAYATNGSDDAWGDRDESQFLAHVKEYFGDEVPPEAQAVPDSVYLIEGELACKWLSQQPTGTELEHTDYEMFKRFLREVEPSAEWPFDTEPTGVRGSVIYDAWHFLCPDVEDRHIWSPPPPDD